jgi:hypothetical protein
MVSNLLTCRVCVGQVRIDVYCVHLNAFKAYVEEMIKRLREALAASLRRKVCLGMLRRCTLFVGHLQQLELVG